MTSKSTNHHDVNTSANTSRQYSPEESSSSECRPIMITKWTADLSGPRMRAGHHPSWHHRKRAKSDHTNQPPASHANEGSSKSSRTGHRVECKWSPNGHALPSSSISPSSDWLIFQVKPKMFSNNLTSWGSESHSIGPPQKWTREHAP